MKENLEKSLKRFLKRKMKITLATVVSFLIMGLVSYSEEVDGKFVINSDNSDITEEIIKEKLGGKLSSYFDENFGYKNLKINITSDNALVVESIDSKKASLSMIDSEISSTGNTAIKFKDNANNNNNKFSGENVSVSAKQDAVLGSKNNDEVYFGGNSEITGNITLNEGNDIVRISSSNVTGNISMGSGNDSVYIDGNSKINGKIDLGTGNDSIKISKSTITGDIVANSDELGDNIFLENGVTIAGKVLMKNGTLNLNNKVTINELDMSGDNANINLGKDTEISIQNINVTAKEKNLNLKYNINSDEDSNIMKKQIDVFKDKSFTVKLSDNGNKNINLSGVSGIAGIVGGNGADIFIIGEGETELKISDTTDGDNDTLKLSFNTNNNTKLNGGYDKIENLQLANGNNTLNIEGLSFQNIIGGNGDDTFLNVSKEQLTLIKGGYGDDTISMKEELTTDNFTLDDVFGNNGIEKLVLAEGSNDISLNDLTYIGKIDFTKGTNKVNLGDEKSKTEYNFDNSKITGNVTINLNSNIANLGESNLNGSTINLNNSFIDNGKVTFGNGEVRFELGKGIYFTEGSKTSYDLNLGDISLTDGATLSPYAFLNVSEQNDKLTVKTWTELGGKDGNKEGYYEELLKDSYNRDGKEGITSAFNTWNSQEIVDLVENGVITEGDKILEDNSEKYDYALVVNGDLKVEGDKGQIGLEFNKGVSSNKFIISGNGVSNNSITFKGSSTISGGIDATGFDKNLTLNFNQTGDSNINVGGISFGNTKGNNINIGDASTVENIGKITTGENGNAHISITEVGDTSEGFNKILAGANFGNTSISVIENVNDLDITSDYKGNIQFGSGADNINLNSNIGSINTGDGNDTVTVGLDKDMVLNINGGEGNNTFNIGSVSSTLAMGETNPYDSYGTLFGKVIGFGDVNVNKDVKFDSKLTLEGVSNINIGAGNNLVLGVDYSQEKDGKVIGHALYDKGIKVDNTGNLVIDVTGANKNSIISMGETNKTTITDENNILSSNSSVHDVIFDKDGNISVEIKETILGSDESIKYGHLDAIYKSVVDAGKISEMAPSTSLTDKTQEESIKAQLEYYGKIYSASPYAYSNDISRESAKLINNNILDSRFKAEKGEWIHYGAIIGQGQDSDYSYNGTGHYKVDIGTLNVDVDSNVYGAYYMGEYGKSEKLALGYVIAGNKSDANIGESSLDGNGIYLGAYAKYQVNKFDLVAGLGYQHNNYDADRKTSNKYQVISTSEKYDDNTLIAYIGAKYTHQLKENTTLEPYARLNLTHVMQDSIGEKDKGDLSISVDSQDFTAIDTEVGVNLVKTVMVEKGKVNLFAGVGVEVSLTGYDTEYLTARINGANKSFDIISDENDRLKGKISVGVEFEKENGIFYNAKGSIIKSDNTDDYNFGLGIGYRF